MARPFPIPRGQMIAHDLLQTDIARRLLMSERTVTRKLCGRAPWTLDEMYTLMDLLHWPYDRMHELFPKSGASSRFQEQKGATA